VQYFVKYYFSDLSSITESIQNFNGAFQLQKAAAPPLD